MSQELPYAEGDVFGIPLEGGEWALGMVTRVAPGGRVVIGHFFGPRRAAPPEPGDLPDVTAEAAVTVERFGDLGLFDGSWPVPAFRRVDVVSGAVRRVVYDDADPAEEIAAEPVAPGEAEDLPNDGLQGAIGMSRLLTKRLS